MKNIFKSLMIVVLFVGLGSSAFAQENDNIKASATVMTALSITGDVDMNFGNISATTDGDVYLDPKGAASTYVGAQAVAGKFIIAGANSTDLLISWGGSVPLTSGANTMNLNVAIFGFDADTQSASTLLDTPAGTLRTTSGTGNYYLWAGGSLGKLTAKAIGTYEGTVTVTVAYN
ncbi:MAG: DUF4402 domain-containing protein [Bacteroidales bacterium]|nr:DUF4402 domain-containing protein [Bacteroidales bacterium]